MTLAACRLARIAALCALLQCVAANALAQFNSNCTVSVLNRNVIVNPDGSWVLPNIPANFGPVRARVACIVNGQTISGESEPFIVPPNGVVNLPHIVFGPTTPIPTALTITATTQTLTQPGASVQLAVSAQYSNGTTTDVTAAANGTQYTISNTAIATVSADGLVLAVQSGTVLIQATLEGASGLTSIQVLFAGAAHGGIPDSWAIAHGLNPNDPIMPSDDPDHDGLTNLEEFQQGTDPNNPDTDSDGLSDGDEIHVYHTNPLLSDSDGDGIPDGVEVRTGTDPLNRNSYDLRAATASSALRPSSLVLVTSTLFPNASVQLSWTVNLIDGKTTLDLTADARTHYNSSNLNVCSFSAQPGLVFAGATGGCVITISQSTLSVTVPGTVQAFTPNEISTLNVPGSVAVDVSGNFAYVAAGTNGLVIVDVSDRVHPRTRGTLAAIGNAQAVRAAGQYVYLGDFNGSLRVVQVANPDAPVLVTSLSITGQPTALAVHGGLAAVAARSGGVSLINITNPTTPVLLATVSLPAAALGVDFDLQHALAAVAMGTAGLQLIDISNTTAPRLRGIMTGGDVRRVLLDYPAVLLADVQRSVTAVDITNPDHPLLTSSIPANLGGAPVDIASFGAIAITADSSFGRAIPVLNVSNPLQPNTVMFWTPTSPGFGSSIAMDQEFGYLIFPGTLRIFQYQDIVDNFGLPPVIQITSPAAGTPVVQGSALTVTAIAADDIGVASVTFLVNGQAVLATASAPYQFTFTAPSAGSTLTLGATAVDYGGNLGIAPDVTIDLIPDPLTTVTGTVLSASQPIAGATVTCGGHSGVTGPDGTFAVTGVPTLLPVVCGGQAVASGTTLGGSSAPVTPVRGGTTEIGILAIGPVPLITAVSPRAALFNAVLTNLTITGQNLAGSIFSFPGSTIAVTSTSINPAGTSAILSISTGNKAGTFALVVTNASGSSGTAITPADRFAVVDPASTADTDGDGIPDAVEVVLGTDPLDSTSVPAAGGFAGSGESDALTFSILNLAGFTGGAQQRPEADGQPVSILNLAGAAPDQPTTREATTQPFAVLNLAGAAPGQPTTREATTQPFSILNLAGAALGQPATHEAGAQLFSVLNLAGMTGGAPISGEADAFPFAVLNTGGSVSGTPTAREAGVTPFSALNLAGASVGPMVWALLVSDRATNSIMEYDARTALLLRAIVPSGFGGLNLPDGMAIGSEGDLFVASNQTGSAAVLRYNGLTGAFVNAFVPTSDGAQNITSMTFGPNGHLFVSDYLARNVREYDQGTGAFLRVFAALANNGCCAQGLAFGPNGHLYVTTEASIQEFDSAGTFVKAFAFNPSIAPTGVTFGPDAKIYVSTTAGIQKYDPTTGAFIATFVPAGTGGLGFAHSLRFGPDGLLYVVDTTNGRVLRFNGTTGAFIDIFASGLVMPFNLTFGWVGR